MLVSANHPNYPYNKPPYGGYDPYRSKPVYPSYPPRVYEPAYPTYQHNDEIYPEEEPSNYEFQYGVKDAYTGQDFKHTEKHNGDKTSGSYAVALPDGRTQVVTYTADDANGFVAEVVYEGEAQKSDYPVPQYPAPHYPPTPYKKPVEHLVPRYQPIPIHHDAERFEGPIFRPPAPVTVAPEVTEAANIETTEAPVDEIAITDVAEDLTESPSTELPTTEAIEEQVAEEVTTKVPSKALQAPYKAPYKVPYHIPHYKKPGPYRAPYPSYRPPHATRYTSYHDRYRAAYPPKPRLAYPPYKRPEYPPRRY